MERCAALLNLDQLVCIISPNYIDFVVAILFRGLRFLCVEAGSSLLHKTSSACYRIHTRANILHNDDGTAAAAAGPAIRRAGCCNATVGFLCRVSSLNSLDIDVCLALLGGAALA